jgi:hypothetical protein
MLCTTQEREEGSLQSDRWDMDLSGFRGYLRAAAVQE